MDKQQQEYLAELFEQWSGKAPEQITPLPKSGSDRLYARLSAGELSAIGAYNSDEAENRAFVAFTRHFQERQLAVPQLYATDLDRHVYLQEDLGDQTLLMALQSARQESGEAFPQSIRGLYEASLSELARLQVIGGKELDFSLSYPRAQFDATAMGWDLNYFKYFFFKLPGLSFHEQ